MCALARPRHLLQGNALLPNATDECNPELTAALLRQIAGIDIHSTLVTVWVRGERDGGGVGRARHRSGATGVDDRVLLKGRRLWLSDAPPRCKPTCTSRATLHLPTTRTWPTRSRTLPSY